MSKSSTVTLRLDPLLKLSAELTARTHRRSLSGYIEWAVDQALQSEEIFVHDPIDGTDTWVVAKDLASMIWDPSDAKLFVNRMYLFPHLATYDEQKLFSLVKYCDFLWYGNYNDKGNWEKTIAIKSNLILNRLEEHWDILNAVAADKAPASKLPKWHENKNRAPIGGDGPLIDLVESE